MIRTKPDVSKNALKVSDFQNLGMGVWAVAIVASLGYFVDIYDLLLFSIVRVASLRALGVENDKLLSLGVLLIDVQMAGLLLGGIFWGILGDKRGRLSVLFGSILLYSLANIANAFVQTVAQYAALRFIAGLGLAGELGAGIVLISEILPIRLRGYGTAFIASIGILGAVFGGLIGDAFPWRISFAIGGALGLLVLALRVGVKESHLFTQTKERAEIVRGDFLSLFRNRALFRKYLSIVVIGVPIWFIVGILMTFTPEISDSLGMAQAPSAAKAIMFCYAGLAIGDFTSGMLSQALQSRKKAILVYLLFSCVAIACHLRWSGTSVSVYYVSCAILGFGGGYWAMFVTVAAEQFGTNIRATVATTAPNFVRGAVIPLSLIFQLLDAPFGAVAAAAIVGCVFLAAAIVALTQIDETFHKDLSADSGAP